MLGEMIRHRLRRQVAGLTIVEAVVTIGIVAVLAAVALPSMRNFMMQQRVKSVARELLADIQLARTTALQQTGTGVGTFYVELAFAVKAAGTCYVIVPTQKSDVVCDCSYDKSVKDATLCTGGGTTGRSRTPIKTVNIDTSRGVRTTGPAAGPMFYETSTGVLVDRVSKTISVTGDSVGSLNILVNAAGLPRICVPSGSNFSGFPAC